MGSGALNTVVDFLLEVTRGIHFFEKEAGFVDLFALQDPATGAGHPLLAVLHADEHAKAVNLRRQMDDLAATTLGADSAAWWEANVAMLGVTLSPKNPYKVDRTTRRAFPGVLEFDDLMAERAPGVGRGLPSGFDPFDLESAMLACGRMSLAAGSRLPLPVLMALMETEGIKLFAPITRLVRNTDVAAETLVWEALSRDLAHDMGRLPVSETALLADPDQRARQLMLWFPYGLDRFGNPSTDTDVNARVATAEVAGVFTRSPSENVAEYIRNRVFSFFLPLPHLGAPLVGVPQIWKRSRRVHWAILSLMAGFYRELELDMNGAKNGFARAGWPEPAWLPTAPHPPMLTAAAGGTAVPTDPEWKDYLSYYGMIYVAYNSSPSSLLAFVDGANAARAAAGSTLSPRDFLLFKHSRDKDIIQRMVRFVIALDAYLRLDFMHGVPPADYAAASADITSPAGRSWGP